MPEMEPRTSSESDSPSATIVKSSLSSDELIRMFRLMLLTRILDAKIVSINRQGRIGPVISCAGEEATMVASAFALKKEDWMISSYREMGAHLVRETSIDLILAQLYGNSNDLLKGRQMSNSWGNKELNIVPTAAPIGAYLPMAVGISLAGKLRKQHFAVLTFMGDGGTSSSDFHTAMNFAGVYRTPTVFICRNNQWAISLPVSMQTASKTIAIKAEAYGFEGIQVDGNDAIAVYEVTKNALEKARRGGGPTFIEALTYRMGPHSTADDPSRYQDKAEVEKMKLRDPLDLLRNKITKMGIWNSEMEKQATKEFEREIASSIERQEKTKPLPVPDLYFTDVYEKETANLIEQKAELAEYLHSEEHSE